VHELWWNNTDGWHHDDLSGATGAPAAQDGFNCAPAAYLFDAQRTQHFVYVGVDRHIYDLWWAGPSARRIGCRSR
jgi:hypothetical protein